MSAYFNHKHVIPESQYGFVKNKSVLLLLVETIDDWTKALDNHQLVDIVYFDFSKAFNSVYIA